jgi:protein-tyrosine phosphatase
MIDLHCHMLPGIDDGATDVAVSLEMARLAVADGVTVTACTPHIYPGLYDNNAQGIKQGVLSLRQSFVDAGIPLKLTYGADAHIGPDLLDGLKTGRVPTLNGGRYFLLEPTHHVHPPRFKETVFDIIVAGYVPVVTHPERLTWIDDKHYETFHELVQQGAWMQVTSGALVGKFGKKARYWAEKFVGDGITHIIASDGHTTGRRAPTMSEGRDVVSKLVGAEEAAACTEGRPRAILLNAPPTSVMAPPGVDKMHKLRNTQSVKSRLLRWFA